MAVVVVESIHVWPILYRLGKNLYFAICPLFYLLWPNPNPGAICRSSECGNRLFSQDAPTVARSAGIRCVLVPLSTPLANLERQLYRPVNVP